MTEFIVVRAQKSDATGLAEIGASTFKETFGAEDDENDPADLAAYLTGAFSAEIQTKEMEQVGSYFLLLYREDKIIGYARLFDCTPPADVQFAVQSAALTQSIELVRFYIIREWQGRGAAGELMKASVMLAQTLGYEALWLGVWQKNPRAIAFYRKWGFEKVGQWTFTLGSDVQTDDLMLRKIEEEGL